MKLRLSAWAIVIVSFAGGVWVTLHTQVVRGTYPITLGLSLTTSLLSFGSVPFFLMGLTHFKADLKRAYAVLCSGIAMLGLAQLQLPILSVTGLWTWSDIGGIVVPYLVAFVLVLWGIRLFAKTLKLHSFESSLWVATGCALGLIVLSLLVPHGPTNVSEVAFRVGVGLNIWVTTFATFSALLILRIKKIVGPAYTNAMAWLFIAMVVLSFAGLHYTVVSFLFTHGNWYVDHSITIVPILIGTLILVRAGYAFNAIDAVPHIISRSESFFGIPAHKPSNLNATWLDLVVYAASLVADPRDIDHILDQVREITAKLQPGSDMSQAD